MRDNKFNPKWTPPDLDEIPMEARSVPEGNENQPVAPGSSQICFQPRESTMSEELLPCPFCGNHKANLFPPTCLPSTPYDPAGRLYPVVRCAQCYVDVPGKNLDYKGRSAIAAWNKRAAISVSDGGGSDASGVSPLEKKEAVTRNTADAKVRAMAMMELYQIVNIDMARMRADFGADADRQFREWAQNRARSVITAVEKLVLSEHDGQPESDRDSDYERDEFISVGAASAVKNFANAILHGDDIHRAWLLEAADAWGDGREIPAPRSGKPSSVGVTGQPESATVVSSPKDSSEES